MAEWNLFQHKSRRQIVVTQYNDFVTYLNINMPLTKFIQALIKYLT